MPRSVTLIVLLCLCLLQSAAFAQAIIGDVLDADSRQPLANTTIQNATTSYVFTTDSAGHFSFMAEKGQLLQFSQLGYKTAWVRVPSYIPPYFRIILEKVVPPLPDPRQGPIKDYKTDSIRFRELYKHELDFPTMSAVDMISHPFSALSKRSQEIWAFQKDYDATQKIKYVNYTFNPTLVTNLTGLQGDSLNSYMRRYRPTYEQLRSMNEYTFYNYIKNTVMRFRHPNVGHSRNSG